MAKEKLNQETGMILVATFGVLLVVNSLVIYLASLLFPNQVVLGTVNIPVWWAVFCSMAILALIGTFAVPFVRLAENKRGRMMTNKEWMGLYFGLNFVGVWLIARLAEFVGLGISSWVVALVLAIVLDAAQGAGMMWLEKKRKSSNIF